MPIDETILGGARRGRARPRGFIANWNPQPQTRALLEQVRAILSAKSRLPPGNPG